MTLDKSENDNIFMQYILEQGEYLARVMIDNKEQLVLLKSMPKSSSSMQEIEVDNEAIAKSSLVSNAENVIPKMSRSNSENISETCLMKLNDTALEEILIEEVRKRPPLYDYTLPLTARGRQKIVDLWKEISEALDGKYFIQMYIKNYIIYLIF